MSLPTQIPSQNPVQNEIRTQLLILVALAALALFAAKFFAKTKEPAALPAPAIEEVQVNGTEVNWDDVNLATGRVVDPETTVKTLRSKMLSDFEAR